MRLGGGGVAAGGDGTVLGVQHTFFRNADETAGLLHAGEHILHHGAALVHHNGGVDAVLGEIRHDVGRTLTVDLITAGEGKVNVLFRLEALTDEVIGGGKNAVEGDLGVQRAAAPENAVLDDPGEGRLVPLFLVDRHHVIVRHHNGRVAFLLARPPQQQRPVGKLLEGAGAEHVGVKCRQQRDQLLKFPLVLQRMVVVGHGLARESTAASRSKAISSLVTSGWGLGRKRMVRMATTAMNATRTARIRYPIMFTELLSYKAAGKRQW